MFRDIRMAGTISIRGIFLCCVLSMFVLSGLVAQKPPVVLEQRLLRVEAPAENEKYAKSVLSHATAALRIVNDQAGEAMHIPITFEVVPTEKEFLTRAGGVGENSLAVSLGGQARVLISRPAMAESGSDKIRQVLVHELAHVYLDAKTAAPVPRWVHEGVAQALAGEWADAPSEGRMAIAAYTGGLIPLRNLINGFPSDQTRRDMAYAQSYSVVRYLVRNDFGNSLALFLRAIRGEEGKDYLKSLSGGIHLESVDYRWRSELRHPRFLFTIVLSSGFLWGAAALLLLFAYVVKRRRSKVLRQQWAREEMLAAEYGSMTVPHDTRETWDPETESEFVDYVESDESYLADDEPEDSTGDDTRWR